METELILDFGEEKRFPISKNKNSNLGYDKDIIYPMNEQVQKNKTEKCQYGNKDERRNEFKQSFGV